MTPELVEVREYFQSPTLAFPHGSYRLEVGGQVQFGTGRWKTSNADDKYSWRAHILWQIHEMNCLTIEHPLPWMRPCKAIVKEGPKAIVIYRAPQI
jgi:hypothetical protein